MKYNIIGDIHGRTSWKELVIEDGINIFVGDYFSPYHSEYTFEKCKQNFLNIVQFKKEHPETILLLGNHDADHWQWLVSRTHMSRHDYNHENEICKLFEQNKELFQIAYSIDNKYLVTHAGVSMIWYYANKYRLNEQNRRTITGNFVDLSYQKAQDFDNVRAAYNENEQFKEEHSCGGYKAKYDVKDNMLVLWKDGWYTTQDNKFIPFRNENPNSVAEFLNEYWKTHDFEFRWERNAMHGDCWGDSITQSPMWIRPAELSEVNIFIGTNYKQIVGHTMFRQPTEEDNIIFVDCLEYSNKCHKIIEE